MDTMVSCCGCVCSECEQYPDACRGCVATQGVAYWVQDAGMDVCKLYACCVLERGYASCAECAQFVCDKYYDMPEDSMTQQEFDSRLPRPEDNLQEAVREGGLPGQAKR